MILRDRTHQALPSVDHAYQDVALSGLGVLVGVAEGPIDVLPWADYVVADGGSATSTAAALRDLLACETGEAANQVWDDGFENQVFSQDEVYVEYEGRPPVRAAAHEARLLANDPGAIFRFSIVP